jgi:hypothetical protein
VLRELAESNRIICMYISFSGEVPGGTPHF